MYGLDFSPVLLLVSTGLTFGCWKLFTVLVDGFRYFH